MNKYATRFSLVLLMLMLATSAFAFGKSDILTQRYREAHDKADLEALKQIVCWEGALDITRKLIVARLQEDIKHPIKEIEFKPLKGEITYGAPDFKTNLKPVGLLSITFEDPADGDKIRSKEFLVGEKDGQYLITIASPVGDTVCPRYQKSEDVEKKD